MPDWINVIPLTDDGQVVMVRQYRFGIEGFTLEIPGGMCDPGEPPLEAARREMREETGYAPSEMIELGWVHPNPPLQNNRCFRPAFPCSYSVCAAPLFGCRSRGATKRRRGRPKG